MSAYAIFGIETLNVVIHSHAIKNVKSIWWIRVSGRASVGTIPRQIARDSPFIQKHAAFVPMFLPFLAVVVIEANMAELVEDGQDRRIPPSQNF